MTPPPAWPALMDLTTAGAYLALAPGSLINLLRRENVRPVEISARLRRWRRADLDQLIARLAPAEDGARDLRAAAPDGLDLALTAVERRSTQRQRRLTDRRSREVRQPHPAA